MMFATPATAQIEKGTYFCGMSSAYSTPMEMSSILSLGYVRHTGYDYLNEKYTTETWSFNVLPKAGYFVIQNLAIGLNAGLSYSSTTELNHSYKNTNRTLGLGPFVRYYVKSKKVYPVFELGLDYWKKHNYFRNESLDSLLVLSTQESTSSSSYLCYNIGAGIAIPITQKVSFDLLLTYSLLRRQYNYTYFNSNEVQDNSTRIISVRFGFVFFLHKAPSSNQDITN